MGKDMNENLPEPDDLPKVCIAPTWEQNTMMLCMILRDGSSDGKEHAQREILRMARLLDQMGVQKPRS